jgi:hypothetical protein
MAAGLPDQLGSLPSWRPGPARDAVSGFLDAATEVAPRDRVACFDDDGTLWCERPHYVQLDFLIDALRARSAENPSAASTPEFAALLSGDKAAVGELGLTRIAMAALVGLFEAMTAEAFTDRLRDFLDRANHPTLAVVGTMVTYAYSADPAGPDGIPRPLLRRTTGLTGAANEGAAAVCNIQVQLVRRPILAAGNSGGDRQVLEWAVGGAGPIPALLIDHDDEHREFRYLSSAETFAEPEPITEVGARQGWTVVSMANGWATVFGDDAHGWNAPRSSG